MSMSVEFSLPTVMKDISGPPGLGEQGPSGCECPDLTVAPRVAVGIGQVTPYQGRDRVGLVAAPNAMPTTGSVGFRWARHQTGGRGGNVRLRRGRTRDLRFRF